MTCLFFTAACLAVVAGAAPPEEKPASQPGADQEADRADDSPADPTKWKPLTDSWEVCRFGGEGPVAIEGKQITLGYGDPMTGVRWSGEFPRDRYELRMEARRTEGFDFFCGTTFPVGEEGKCSLILGGWGGGVLGLSSIDGQDASSNATTQFKTFDNGQWYKIRIRVTPERIKCWIDGNVWVDQPRGDHEFDIRYEMDPTVPMGLANYQCRSEIRNIEFRRLTTELDDSPRGSRGDAAAEPTEQQAGEPAEQQAPAAAAEAQEQ